jgi:type II secretion system protein I
MRMRGFTLVEVLIALVIITVAFVAILNGSVFNLRSERRASDITRAVTAADMMMKEVIAGGYPASGTEEGEFEDDSFKGLTWKKSVEAIEFPYLEELKLVTIEIHWGQNDSYTLRTVLSRY